MLLVSARARGGRCRGRGAFLQRACSEGLLHEAAVVFVQLLTGEAGAGEAAPARRAPVSAEVALRQIAGDECFETVDRMERKPDDPTTGPFAVAMLRLACCSGCGGPAIRIRYEQPRYTRELALFELHGMIQDLRRIRQD